MTAENTVATFPIQKKEWDEEMDLEELIQNFRLEAIQFLNQKRKGEIVFTPEGIRAIKTVNAICRENGYPLIIEDISELH